MKIKTNDLGVGSHKIFGIPPICEKCKSKTFVGNFITKDENLFTGGKYIFICYSCRKLYYEFIK